MVSVPRAEGVGRLFMREVADVHRELYTEYGELYGEDVRIKVERCLEVSEGEAAEAGRRRDAYREEVENALDGLDLLLTPTLAAVAPRIGEGGIGDLDVRERMIENTFPFNAVGYPALALPCGSAEDGLPASLQVAGRRGADALVLATGRALEPLLAG
jgi:Asp-tRNA(Asn)/Glu-tRNA(Gln) amidotransferase A subunit family amidase